MIRLGLAGVAWVALATPAQAQDTDASALEGLRECAGIAADAARLACYDERAKTLLAATDSGEIEVVDRESVTKTKRELFGFQGVNIPFFKDEADIDQIESTVTRVQRYGREGYLITIEEGGAVWRITNPPGRFRTPRAGDTIVIARGSLSSHFLRIGSQLGVKGRRVE